MTLNIGNASTLVDNSGATIGRVVPRKERHLGVAVAFPMKDGTLAVRTYGPVEWASKRTVNGWELKPSYLTVARCAFNSADETVSVTLLHNLHSGWNQLITVPLRDGWQQEINKKLMELSKATGSETHISNYSCLVV
jgi:hypothetical protein